MNSSNLTSYLSTKSYICIKHTCRESDIFLPYKVFNSPHFGQGLHTMFKLLSNWTGCGMTKNSVDSSKEATNSGTLVLRETVSVHLCTKTQGFFHLCVVVIELTTN